jgi:hypothetical protein
VDVRAGWGPWPPCLGGTRLRGGAELAVDEVGERLPHERGELIGRDVVEGVAAFDEDLGDHAGDRRHWDPFAHGNRGGGEDSREPGFEVLVLLTVAVAPREGLEGAGVAAAEEHQFAVLDHEVDQFVGQSWPQGDSRGSVGSGFQLEPAVLVGRTLTDLLTATLCALIVIATGLVIGWRPHADVGDAIASFAIFLLFSYALSWGCACIGLFSRDSESSQGLGLVILFPLAIVSDALVPTQHMPAAVRTIANWNPVSAVTAASRSLFGNPSPAAAVHAWPLQHPVLASVLWSVVLLAIFAPLATRLYRTRTAD